MTIDVSPVNTVAPLRNVALLADLVERVANRPSGLPGMGCFHGPSGYGKTFAAIYAANRHRAYHVQVKSVWTRKKLCLAVLLEMGVQPAGTIPDMVDQIGQELSLSRRPLVIDEADFLVSKGMIEVVRDIYESSQGTVILIGEEQLPQKLKVWERVHGRMLDWVGAEPGTLADTRHLAKLYCRGVVTADDLQKELHEKSAGSVRRICVNWDRVREKAEAADIKEIDLATWLRLGGEFFTGNPPPRRTF
ncbi:MAG: ATP-binding protein [Magnetospirillum sp.]|nr:ATP-binding protein [Magnetospirillum sp.]